MHRASWYLLFVAAATVTSGDGISPLSSPPLAVNHAPVIDINNNKFLRGILDSVMSPNGPNVSRLLTSFDVSPCMQSCSPSVMRLLDGLAVTRANDADAMISLCKELKSLKACTMSAGAGTSCNSTLVDFVQNSYKLACQKNGFESLGDSLQCAKRAMISHRVDCEQACLENSAARALNSTGQPVDLAAICSSSICLLGCVQRSVNAVCRKDDNGLIDTVFTSPKSGSDVTPLSSLLRNLLPVQCAEFANKPMAAGGVPLSVGKPLEMLLADATSTTTTTTTTAAPSTSSTPSNALLEEFDPVGARLTVSGELRMVQCRLLDWEGQPIFTPPIEYLTRLMNEQLVKARKFGDSPMLRADDGESSAPMDVAYRRWVDGQNNQKLREIGFGARADDSGLVSASPVNEEELTTPSWGQLLFAVAVPLIMFAFY